MPNNISVFLKEEFTENNPEFSLYNKVDLQRLKFIPMNPRAIYIHRPILCSWAPKKYEVNWYFYWTNNCQMKIGIYFIKHWN